MILQKIKAWFTGKKTDEPKSSEFKTGTLLFFNRKKGYGFINSEEAAKDVYVHIKDTKGRLRKGDKVRFKVEPTEKGLRARNVELIKSMKKVKRKANAG